MSRRMESSFTQLIMRQGGLSRDFKVITAETPLKTVKNMKKFSKVSILICSHIHIGLHNKSCGGELCQTLIEQLKQQIIEQKLDISIREQACFGRCEEGRVARIYPCKEFFMPVTKNSLAELINRAKRTL